jgi:hypothetical protein
MTRSVSSRSVARAETRRRGASRTRALSAARLDAMHEAGVDLRAHPDLAKAKRPGRQVQRVIVDIPVDLLCAVDRKANRIGVTKRAFICSQRRHACWPHGRGPRREDSV